MRYHQYLPGTKMLSKLKTDNRYVIFCCFAFLFLLTISPFIIFKFPILVDYPNHLTSFYIQANIDNDQWLRENYLIKWVAKPYIIIEWFGGVLARYVDIYLAGRIVLISGILFICAGGLLIRKVINGYVDLWTCAIFTLIYNYVLFFGFVNYYVSSGLALIAMGLWIKLRDINTIANILLFSAISTALYFCHLYALGVYAIFVIGYESGLIKYANNKLFSANTVKTLSQFLLPFILYFIWWSNYTQNGPFVFYNYGDFTAKIIALFSPFAFDFSQHDLLLILLILISVFILRLVHPGGVGIYDNMKIPLLSLLIVVILMPSSLAGTWGTDFRYPFIFMALFVVSIKFDENNKNALHSRNYLLVLVFAITCYKIYYVSDNWKKINQQYQEFENALQYVDRGSKVLAIQDDAKNLTGYNPRLYDHMPALSIIQRSTFWPNLFTYGNSIYPTSRTEHIDTAASPNLTFNDLINHKYKNGDLYGVNCKVYWETWQQDFDYLISIRFNNLSTIDLKNLNLKFRGSFFDIYQIIHQQIVEKPS